MARTLEELDKAVAALDAEMAASRRENSPGVHPLRRLAGHYTGDEEWKAIFDDIQRQRQKEFEEAQERPYRVAP